MSTALVQAREAVQQLPMQRRVLLGALVVGVIGALLLVARWAGQPDYALLFGGLPAQEAGRIVETLEGEGVKYDLRDGGGSIYVPRDEVYGLRLRLATDGVVSEGPAGYELFDGGTLGMTDFMQRLNVKRALEGELSRTIGAVRQIERARVHLVLPERSPFREQQVEPSASVVLAVRGSLGPDQVSGITALVAGAVEGLAPTSVTVLDEAGRMLAGPDAGGVEAGLSTAQVRMRREVEGHLAGAGQSMLDQLLGPGRAVVRVAADLELSRTSTETNAVDPESQTLLSEEVQQETGDGGAANSSVRNFDITRQTTREEREAGAIRTLTVSVLLDQVAPAADPTLEREPGAPSPFTDEQLRQVEALVKNAVGFNEERGDQFAVQQFQFSTPEEAGGFFAQADAAAWTGLGLRYGMVLLVLVLAYRLLKRLADGLTGDGELGALGEAPTPTALPASGGPSALSVGEGGELLGLPEGAPSPTVIGSVEADPYAAKLSPEAQRLADASRLADDLRASVEADPEAAAAVVRSWLREEPVSA